MSSRWRSALPLAAVVLLLGPALTAMASAQEAMQLDLEFRNSLLRGPAPREQGGSTPSSAKADPRRQAPPQAAPTPSREGVTGDRRVLTIPAGLRPRR
jgi:hypothetical protein